MSKVLASVWSFLASDDGPTAVEYAVMITMILVVCIPVITTIGQANNNNMETINTAIE